ncbi:MAG: Hsp20/alpha crystallin family protein [Gemmatimonadota bacterium]
MSPWRDFGNLEDRIRSMFEPTFADPLPLAWAPIVDVEETDDELFLTAELPGMTDEDVDIEVEGNILTLHGNKKDEYEKEEVKGDRRMRIWERRFGEFSRTFSLPSTVKVDAIKAEFDNGILTVHMPKTAEAKGRRIAIKAAK